MLIPIYTSIAAKGLKQPQAPGTGAPSRSGSHLLQQRGRPPWTQFHFEPRCSGHFQAEPPASQPRGSLRPAVALTCTEPLPTAVPGWQQGPENTFGRVPFWNTLLPFRL